jgi:beta-galactosidase
MSASFFSPGNLSLGVCYYPEQWNITRCLNDTSEMALLGLDYVRIAEFMWSTLEPVQGQFEWSELDDAIDALNQAGLKVILGTPTATPPKWLVDLHPDILPYDDQNRSRHFGSRRHYSFSSPAYFTATRDIVTAMASRYGKHPAVVGWQIDNEFGCHDTVRTYDPNALIAFRAWLQVKYITIDALNEAWGNVFWSMHYSGFEQVDLPMLTVTEANPAARMDFFRFSSDQVIAYSQLHADILREYSPGRFLTHNLMGFFFQFDAFALSQMLDGVTWDNYPLGFTDTTLGLGDVISDSDKVLFTRTGHPDIASFHHALYRAVGGGRFGVMEQQPGPVNWAQHNPSPAPGMVRVWTWEAFAHGASVVSYFRWRQAPFAQEQMHSGLHRRDGSRDIGYFEAQQVLREIQSLSQYGPLLPENSVAMAFDFSAFWAYEIQPQGKEWSYPALVFLIYSTLRRLGVDVDFVNLDRIMNLDQYHTIIVPSLPFLSPAALAKLRAFQGTIVFGPRSGSKTSSFQIPADLPPSTSEPCNPALQAFLPLKVVRVESFRADYYENITFAGQTYPVSIWKEWLEIPAESNSKVRATFEDNRPALVVVSESKQELHYIGFWPSQAFLDVYFRDIFHHQFEAKPELSPIVDLNDTFRVTRVGLLEFGFNYGNREANVPDYARCYIIYILGYC